MTSFHEVEFPIRLALGLSGGPSFSTEIVISGGGNEQRIGRWSRALRSWNAKQAISSLQDLYRVLDFFHARRGRLHGFRFLDPLDHTSLQPDHVPTSQDQSIDTADGNTRSFSLIKNYGGASYNVTRPITKPISGSVLVAINGVDLAASAFSVNTSTGVVTLSHGISTPASGSTITAGYRFHTPVRFDTDSLTVSHSSFSSGDIPDIPILELR